MKIKFAIVAFMAAMSFSAHADVPTPNDANYCYSIGRLATDFENMAKKEGVSVAQMVQSTMESAKRNRLDPQAIANYDMALEYFNESHKSGETRKPAEICQEDSDIMSSIQPYDPDKN